MIIVKRKPLDEVLNMVGSAKKVLIVGCDGCVGIYQEGGQKQVELMKIMLDMAKKLKESKGLKLIPQWFSDNAIEECVQPRFNP